MEERKSKSSEERGHHAEDESWEEEKRYFSRWYDDEFLVRYNGNGRGRSRTNYVEKHEKDRSQQETGSTWA